MNSPHLKTVQAIADLCSVSWNSAKKWTGAKGFPAKTKNGWNRTEVTAWVAQRLKHAAECQTGSDQDLKRQLMQARLSILEADLATRQIGLSNAAADTVPREVLLTMLNAYGFCVYGALKAWKDHLANDPKLAITPNEYAAIGDHVSSLLNTMKRNVGWVIDDPKTAFDEAIDITFNEDEKLRINESFRYQA